MSGPSGELVIMIHGVWMARWVMALQAWRMRRMGFRVRSFVHYSVWFTPPHNARRLSRYIERLRREPGQPVHLLGHSLGGIVMAHYMAAHPDHQGRSVLLGSPLGGSQVAHFWSRRPWLRWLLGRSLQQGLLGDIPKWPAHLRPAMIIGTRNMGIGTILGILPKEIPGDGTVAVSETAPGYAAASLRLPITHTEMMWSRAAIQAAASWFRDGVLPSEPDAHQ